jgi:ATP/maltotriose-dependent transcriptional regulator MalT
MSLLGQCYPSFALGRWDKVLALTAEAPEEQWTELRLAFNILASVGVLVHVHRGSYEKASEILETFAEFETSSDVQERASFACGKSSLLLARGEAADALRIAEDAFRTRDAMGVTIEYVKEAFVVAVEAALELNDVAKAEALIGAVDGLPPGRYPQFVRAQSSRFKARLADDSADAERYFKGAAGLFRELAVPFYLAVTELEHSEWLVTQGRAEEAEPLLAEAREIFERLGAKPWVERMEAVSAPRPAEARA